MQFLDFSIHRERSTKACFVSFYPLVLIACAYKLAIKIFHADLSSRNNTKRAEFDSRRPIKG